MAQIFNTAYAYFTGSVTIGDGSLAGKDYATAIGHNAIASGAYSHANGETVSAVNQSEFVIGQFNTNTIYEGTNGSFGPHESTLFVIGNGTDSSHKSNAFEIMQNGNAHHAGNVNINGSLDVDTNLNVDGTTTLVGDTNVKGSLDVDTNLNIDGTSTLVGDTNVKGSLDVDTNLNVDGTTTLVGDTNVKGSLDVDTNLTVDGLFTDVTNTGAAETTAVKREIITNVNITQGLDYSYAYAKHTYIYTSQADSIVNAGDNTDNVEYIYSPKISTTHYDLGLDGVAFWGGSL